MLKEQIELDIKDAMLKKDTIRLGALRALKTAIVVAGSEKGFTGEIDDEKVLTLIQKQIKQRQDSANQFTNGGRPELAGVELAEIIHLEAYLPTQLGRDEIQSEVNNALSSTGATTKKDMGKVMAALAHLNGKCDKKVLSDIVKELLA